MSWPFSFRRLLYPEEHYIWLKIRILHETDKAILVDNGRKFWIPKSQIYGVRLRSGVFEIFIKAHGEHKDYEDGTHAKDAEEACVIFKDRISQSSNGVECWDVEDLMPYVRESKQ